jgi:carbon monoxide dehydrogenase subunit G
VVVGLRFGPVAVWRPGIARGHPTHRTRTASPPALRSHGCVCRAALAPVPGRAILGPMRRVEAEALVGASRDEVWQLLDDLEGLPRWQPGVRAVTSSGPAHVGTLYRVQSSMLGFPRTRDWEFEQHRPPLRQVRVARDGSMERSLILTLDVRGSGTRLRAEMELRSSLAFPIGLLHEMLATFAAGLSVRQLVEAVKRAFEGRPHR